MKIPHGPILVVEDIANIRDLLRVTLSFKGYPVLTANNGEEAFEIVEKERPALVISDVLMPKMDGFALTHKLRTDPRFHDIPIMLISATYVNPEDRAFAERLGAIHYLEKPVETDDFLLSVAELLTQGPPDLPEPMDEREFCDGYRDRLEEKLTEKNQQIARTRRLLTKLSPDQKPAFESLLKEEIAQREEIQRELDHLYMILKNADNEDS